MQIVGFIKIGKKKHLDDLRSKGLIYCNTVNYFRNLEDSKTNLRGDEYDGSSAHIHLTSLELFKEDGSKIPIIFKKGKLNLYDETSLANHLFCLFTIKTEFTGQGTFIDKRIEDFGDHALIITDTTTFRNRIEVKLNELNVNHEMDFVKYYDSSKDQTNLTVFDKRDEFAYQHELRIHIIGQLETTFSFEIGSIEDISIFVKAKYLSKMRMEFDDKNEP
ncbi:MAG: hypothetical protein JNL57_06315 [Bacteroidetes bacterium]|nr:hypothetical protein [Bacteroidota bacterium]